MLKGLSLRLATCHQVHEQNITECIELHCAVLLLNIDVNVLFLTSVNEFSGIIYSLFTGMQSIFLTIFSTKFVLKCATKIENRLTKTKVMSKNIFE